MISIIKLAFLFVLLLAIFGTITVSCPPSLNDFRYTKNGTLLAEAIAKMQLNSTTAHTAGHHSVAHRSPITVWPHYAKDNKVYIPYCYEDRDTRNAVKDVFDKAWKLWTDALGQPTPATGHRIAGFEETTWKGRQILYCHDQDGSWNSAVREDAVIISADKNGVSFMAIMGYKPVTWYVNSASAEPSVFQRLTTH
jgi:hypothetical protein